MTAVKWLQIKMATSSAEEMVENINVWFAKAKEMEKEQIGYSEEEVKHIISEALQSALVTVDLEQWFNQFKQQEQ